MSSSGWMKREPRRDDPRREALLDQRDHLRIRISLILDEEARNQTQLQSMLEELADIELRIEHHKRPEERRTRRAAA